MRNSADWSRLSFVAKFIEWLFGPLVFLWLATAGIGIVMISRAVDESFDARLEDTAQAVAARLVPTGNPAAPLALTPGVEALLHPVEEVKRDVESKQQRCQERHAQVRAVVNGRKLERVEQPFGRQAEQTPLRRILWEIHSETR